MRNHFIIKRMADDSLFLIDIDKILREKAPKHVKYIPKFVVSYLKRIVHQDELNVFLRESKDKVGVEFLQACLDFLDAKLIVKGEENLSRDGLYTFVSKRNPCLVLSSVMLAASRVRRFVLNYNCSEDRLSVHSQCQHFVT